MALGFETKTGKCCFNLDRTSSGTVVMVTAQQVLCCCCFFETAVNRREQSMEIDEEKTLVKLV